MDGIDERGWTVRTLPTGEVIRFDPARLRRIELGRPRFVWIGRTLWIRTYRAGGFDGYRTLRGRRDVCDNIARAWLDRRDR
jgi:hypothetical protein